jgi:UTP-glucose-1-phosphate uridylyltransferase
LKVRKAVIPAAGLGTRFLPATKALAKEMLPIVDKPTIQFIVEEAKASGIEAWIIHLGIWDMKSHLAGLKATFGALRILTERRSW